MTTYTFTNLNILLLSKSTIKKEAVNKFFQNVGADVINITHIDVSGCGLPNQPVIASVHEGYVFPLKRMLYASTFNNFDAYDYVISIENVINVPTAEDICYIVISKKDVQYFGLSEAIPFDKEILFELQEYKLIKMNDGVEGYPITIGELMRKHDNEIYPKNWMLQLAGIDRVQQIKTALENAFTTII